jgi:hypothetical protein
MTSPDNQSTASLDTDFTKTWRYKVGLFMIIVGNLGVLAAMPVGLALGFGVATIGAVVVGSEVFATASIVFLGMQGFKALKNKIFGAVKGSYTAPVGRTRHRIGIALLLTKVVTTYTMMIYAWDAFAAAKSEGPAAAVWGLDIAQQGDLVWHLFLIGEISFLVAIYVLGADWWEKFRRIFVWEAPAD